MTDTTMERLIALLASLSAKRGAFVLASGRRSNLYVDCRLTAMHPEGQLLIGRAGLAAIRQSGWPVDSVGGLTLGADPIAYAIAHASALAHERGDGEMVRGFTVRKEAKQHGTGKLIEGPFQAGDKVLVVEDVITTGGSALKAVDAIRAAGGDVQGVLALVDRQEGGREALEAAGLKVMSLVTAEQLLPLIA
ncbi:orotate phosphoribosyltransferase [Gemmatimonas sp.]|uniref:orotate phosphoribosyltransferase n=1 Tax=Gemmatimonas sp. TaxID=1962908 RepID=UPI0037C0A8AA